MVLSDSLINPAHFCHLSVHVDLLLGLICLQRLFKYFVAMLQGEPLEAGQEFVDHFADLVSIGYRASEYFDIIFSDETLRGQLQILHIQTARALFGLGIWAILRYGTLKAVLLLQPLSALHRLLQTVLELAVQEYGSL